MHDTQRLEELVRRRDRCKTKLDEAQDALNKAILAASPVVPGDVIEDTDKQVYRVATVGIKTIIGEGDTLQDRLIFEFQRRRVAGRAVSWVRLGKSCAEITDRVVAGKTKVVGHTRG